VPDLAITSSQTPEEFSAANPELVAAGAPSPCSLLVDRSDIEAARAWMDGLVAAGWSAADEVQDDNYISREARGPAALVASFLVSIDPNARTPITQFQLYTQG
jgi:hypothetical protein